MKLLDIVGQRWRISKAAPHVPVGARVLDIGSADGALFQILSSRIRDGVGIDPEPVPNGSRFEILRGSFPADFPDSEPFDAIVALAVLEHIPLGNQPTFAARCKDLLNPGGSLILTVPAPVVDKIVHIEQRLGLADGMELHQHFGFDPTQTIPLFTNVGFLLERHKRFQLGLNNLFVFRRPFVER